MVWPNASPSMIAKRQGKQKRKQRVRELMVLNGMSNKREIATILGGEDMGVNASTISRYMKEIRDDITSEDQAETETKRAMRTRQFQAVHGIAYAAFQRSQESTTETIITEANKPCPECEGKGYLLSDTMIEVNGAIMVGESLIDDKWDSDMENGNKDDDTVRDANTKDGQHKQKESKNTNNSIRESGTIGDEHKQKESKNKGMDKERKSQGREERGQKVKAECKNCNSTGLVKIETITNKTKGSAGDSAFLNIMRACISETAKLEGLKTSSKGESPQYQHESVVMHGHVHMVGNPYDGCTTDELMELKSQLGKTVRRARKRLESTEDKETAAIDVPSEAIRDSDR